MSLRYGPANRTLMRAINESTVLGLIRRNGPIARADIAREARLSAATVTGITTALIDQGLVFEDAPGVSTGGRRPILLSFNRTAGVALGCKITESRLECVTTDLFGTVEQESTIPIPPGATPTDAVALLATEAKRVGDAVAPRRLWGLGVGIAGVVDRPSGTCRLSPFLRWENVPLRSLLEDATGLPVVVDNDVNTLAFAFRGNVVPSDINTFLVVTFGRGVGLGMTLNHESFRGGRGQGGEFGHIPIEPGGPRCECGKDGCLEAIASIPALIRDAETMLGRPIDESELRDLILADDPRLAPMVALLADVIGRSLAILVNILNPDAIVLSGEGSWLATHTLPRITSAMRTNIFDGVSRDLDIRVEARGDEFWAAGAAALMLDETFRPRLEHVQEGPG